MKLKETKIKANLILKKQGLLDNLVLLGVLRVVEVELLSTQSTHDCVEDTELSSSQGSNHNASWQESNSAQFLESSLLSQSDQSGSGASTLVSSLLVDHGKESISRVRNDGSSNTSNNTRGEGNAEVGSLAAGLRGQSRSSVDGLSCLSLHSELGHGVWHLWNSLITCVS